jgi:hypothetical protein
MLLLIALSFTSMVLFCLAMPKHRTQMLTNELSWLLVATCKPLAWFLLMVTFYLSVECYGWSIGPALFFGVLSAALLALILLLTYRPKIIPSLAIVLPITTYCFTAVHYLLVS